MKFNDKPDSELIEILGQIEARMIDKELGIHASDEDEELYWEIIAYFWDKIPKTNETIY